jgi:ABC-2 type transport system ATP-binding protein
MAQLSGYWNIKAQQRVQSVLEQVDLSAASDESLATYSKGMLQRLSIAQTLLTDPQFLILDEPTNGLDPYSQWQVRQIDAVYIIDLALVAGKWLEHRELLLY